MDKEKDYPILIKKRITIPKKHDTSKVLYSPDYYPRYRNTEKPNISTQNIEQRRILIRKYVLPYYYILDNEKTYRKNTSDFISLWLEWQKHKCKSCSLQQGYLSNYNLLMNIKIDRTTKLFDFVTKEVQITPEQWILAISTNQIFHIPIIILQKSILILYRLLENAKMQSIPLYLTELNNNRLILISIVIALKSENEFAPSYSIWTKLVNDLYDEKDMKFMEKEALELLNYEVTLTNNEMIEFRENLKSICIANKNRYSFLFETCPDSQNMLSQ